MEQPIIANGGLQYVPQIAVQYVYLDFDGELTSYNGEILTVDTVEVQDSALTQERIADILSELNARYVDQNVIFVTEKPETSEYSTIYIGKTSAFDAYGSFAGLAETIDEGNKNSTDKAFVMLDSTATDTEIISTISHETDHLLGTLDHGGSGLAAYAAYTSNLLSGQIVYNIELNSPGDLMGIHRGAEANNTHNNGGGMTVYSGGKASSTTVLNRGYLCVSTGGLACNTQINFEGWLLISRGGSACHTTLNASGSMTVYSGGNASYTTINASGSMAVSGAASGVTVNNGGKIVISSEGSVSDLKLNAGGMIGGFSFNSYKYFSQISTTVSIAANVSISNNDMYISRGGSVNEISVRDSGDIYVLSGGTANNVSVLSNGAVFVSNGGVVKNASAADYAFINIFDGGIASDTKVSSGGALLMCGGAVHKGNLNIYNGGTVNVSTDGVIDFSLAGKSSTAYFINNLSLISGAPTYTITVSSSQSYGTYSLAQGASSFTGSMIITDGYQNYGSVTVNGAGFSYCGKSYKLNQSNGNLTLTIDAPDTTPPEKPSAFANTSSPTSSDVVVSARFSSDSETRQYSRNNKDWYTYTTGIAVSSNGSVYFRGIDAAGNISDVTSYIVSNIDKTDPSLNGTPAVITNGQTVTVSWNAASDNVAIAGYTLSLDGTSYKFDSSQRTYTFNSLSYGTHTITLYASDTAGNKSSEKSTNFVIVQSSDIIAPTISKVSLSQGANNYTFTASVTASDDKTAAAKLKYFIKYAATQAGLNSATAVSGKNFTLNEQYAGNTYYYQVGVTDEAGNTAWSSAKKFTVASRGNKVADLQISGYTLSSSSIKCNQSVTINFNVINKGSGAAGSSLAYIYDGDTKLASINISALNAGASAGYTYTIAADTLSVGTHDIRVEVDAAGVIAESDESNNTASQTLTVVSDTLETSSLVVTTAADVVDENDGVTSLREALAYAAELGGKQKITFASDYNIILNSTLNINSDVFIDGENKNVIVSVNTPALDVFSSTAEYLKINNIDFFATNQKDELFEKDQKRGRLLYLKQGEFYLSNSSIEGVKTEVLINTADETYLQIDNCFFGNNNAGERNGGAIFIEGDALINNTTFFNNYAEVGGAVFVGETGKTNIVNCSFVNNSADTGFGISIHNQGSMFVQNSIIVDASRHSKAIGQNMSPYMCIRNNIFSTLYFEASYECYAADNITDCNTMDIYLDVDVDTDNIGNKYLAADPSKIQSISVLSAVDQYNNLYYSVDGVTWFSSDDNNAASTHLNYYLSQNIIGNRHVKNNVTGVLCSDNQLIFTGNSNRISWNGISGSKFVTKISRNDFANSLQISPGSNVVNIFGIPSGEYQWRVSDGKAWYNGNDFISSNVSDIQQEFVSNADGNLDLFFAKANGTWEIGYAAQHLGILNGWSGTNEQVTLTGKNKLTDIFEGSSDANILVMTDDANGDALFVDDIFTSLPGTVSEQQARIAKIDEIRAGAGDDIVDMTSQRFAYVGNGVKIYGGSGNDTIWANSGNNTLFGDAGNDRIVGGSGNDIIIGGIGNDRMHGGGGNDIFCFGGNWGKDTVEQLAGGKITLWFESGVMSNWNASTLTYTDGTNSVKVSGISADNISLKFGDDNSLFYDELANSGCFDDAASEKIFEDKNKGMLA